MPTSINGKADNVDKEKVMPKVGGKHYAYTPKGMKAAKAAAKRTGKKIKKPKAKR